ncbi:MAG: hypothetical protein Q4D45_14160, partial [Lachnospiraceae bacterium]|nr:hypothetical protein [Lachnospiraceae bacterium]
TEEELTEETSKVEELETTATEETGNVTIENPEESKDQVEQNTSSNSTWIKNLFSGISSLFGRR